MTLLNAYSKFVSLGETEREHTKVLHDWLAIDPDFQIADHLIEREVDLMLLVESDTKAELHQASPITLRPRRISL